MKEKIKVQLGDTVRVHAGRNKGDTGVVKAESGSGNKWLVCFGRNMKLGETEVPDTYWVKTEFIEVLM